MDYTLIDLWFLVGCYIPLSIYYLNVRGGPPSMHRVRTCYLVMSAFIIVCLLFDFYWLSLIDAAYRYGLFTLEIWVALGAASLFLFDIIMQLVNLRRMRMRDLQT